MPPDCTSLTHPSLTEFQLSLGPVPYVLTSVDNGESRSTPCVQRGKTPSHVERDSMEDPFRVERDSVGELGPIVILGECGLCRLA